MAQEVHSSNPKGKWNLRKKFHHNERGVNYCSVERTTLQLIHKEIVHKKITELNVLYLDSKTDTDLE